MKSIELFFSKLFWQVVPFPLVALLLGLLTLLWRFWLVDWWKKGGKKRVATASVTSLVLCFGVIVLLGLSPQSKLPFGQKIEAISIEQAEIREQKRVQKEQEERDRELTKELLEAINVANTLRPQINEVAIQTITTDWLVLCRAKIKELSDKEERESYTRRFETIERHFYPDN